MVAHITSQADPVQACPIAPSSTSCSAGGPRRSCGRCTRDGRQRFGELARRITTITPKVLTERLRQLERDGLILRTHYPEMPPRVEYEITQLGRSLAPLFAALSDWSVHLPEVDQARRQHDERR